MNTITIGTPTALLQYRLQLVKNTDIFICDTAEQCEKLRETSSGEGQFPSRVFVTGECWSCIVDMFHAVAPSTLPTGDKIALIKAIRLIGESKGFYLGLKFSKQVADIPGRVGATTRGEVWNVRLELESVCVEVWA